MDNNTDLSCLADGYVVPVDFKKTGVNANELIVGSTGSGKSMSNAYSRLLHTFNSSVVVPVAKRRLKEHFMSLFRQRGYHTIDLDMTCPERCREKYDPMLYIKSDRDVVEMARNLLNAGTGSDAMRFEDPYWNDAATSMLAAEMSMVRMKAEKEKRKVSFAEVIQFHRSIVTDYSSGIVTTSVDEKFKRASRLNPGNQASELWKTVQNVASKTFSCVYSIVNGALDKVFSEDMMKMLKKDQCIDFTMLGRKKTALFITISPMDLCMQNYMNIMYADMFRILFAEAEQRKSGRLIVPVHIICDDFAVTGRINGFDKYMSIFRSAGISVSLLLQSETQLAQMYGEMAATTIINNCDTYVFHGANDIRTCEHIAMRLNRPLSEVMSMPIGKVVVFRRGCAPRMAERYKILEDPYYKEIEDQEKLG